MTERGVFAVDRGLFEHPLFADEKFTEREAWAWLIAEAAWRCRTRRVSSFVVELKRGQVAASVRHLADKWRWHRAKVERFLNKLENETMIKTNAETGITIITVCNYDKYQRVALPVETPTETATEEAPRQERDNTEALKHLNITKEDIRAVAVAPRPDVNAKFDEFWVAYPRRHGANPSSPARDQFKAKVKSGVDPDEIIAATKRYAAEAQASGQVNTAYVAQAVTWLRQSRWNDYAATAPTEGPLASGQFYALRDSDEFIAWDLEMRRTTGKGLFVGRGGGWLAPSRWPPGYNPPKTNAPTAPAINVRPM